MKLEFKAKYLVGMFFGIGIIALDLYLFLGKRWFWPVLILGLTVFWLQLWLSYFAELKRQREIELQFTEFIRALVESVKSGISIPKSILHVSKKDFGSLNPHIKKLANQIEWGIPTNKALTTFSLDTQNTVIKRSIAILVEAEQSGGDIRDILSSVVESVVNVKKLKEERKASVYSQTMQGYIIFYIFIAIMLVLQLWLFPRLTSLSVQLSEGFGSTTSTFNLDRTFFSLIMIQGFFAGIMIGKFSEGTLRNGLLHSLILMTTSALIVTTIKGTF